MNSIFAERLRNARKIRCLSQRGLCNLLEGRLSPTAIAKYEKGEMTPSSEILIALSRALNMSLDYFFRPFTTNIDTTKFEFRKKASLKVKAIESIKYSICDEIERYVEIESLLGIRNEFKLDYSNSVVESENDAIASAKRFRKDMQIGSDAIVSAIELLESSGVKIIEIEADESFSGTCNKAGEMPVIVVNKKIPSERRRLTIFHELGHLLMTCSKDVDNEKMCNIFANEVLMPTDRFVARIGMNRHDISLVELQAIQREYGISVDALMMKAKQLNIITDSRYASFCKKKNAVREFKRAVEASVYPTEYTNRYKTLVYRALASEIITYSKAAAMLNTSVEDIRSTINLM